MADEPVDTSSPPIPAKRGAVSHKTKLVRLIVHSGVELFHSPDGHPYATVLVSSPNGASHSETMSLAGNTFKEYLSREYYNAKKTVVSSSDLKDAISVLTSSAIHNGTEHQVFIRLARVKDREGQDTIWLDLGHPQWNAVKITSTGWSIISDPEVKFRRSRGLLALPAPVTTDRSIAEMLTTLINVDDPLLLIAWLVGALRGRKPYPILSITGEQGTAKSSACRWLRRLIDPNTADLRLTPKEPRDLMIAAINSHVIAYDNLSGVPDWLSDALCMISTGGGFSTRQLFSDMDEILFSAERPIMLNGINDIVTRPDLLDRALVVTLNPISEENRRSELELEANFEAIRPAILGGLLCAVQTALRDEATTKISHLPRMADFATWMVAAGPALGLTNGTFLEAYRINQQEAIESVLDGDMISDAVMQLKFVDDRWVGQLKDLLDLIPEHEHKPKSPRGLRSALRRKAPALRQAGFTMTYTRGKVRLLEIERVCDGEVRLPLREPDVPF